MGIERDFLMRQLMMLFEVISRMIRFRKKGENDKTREEIGYFYACLHIEDDLQKLNIQQLLHYLVTDKKLTNEHIELIAFVLKEQGELSANEEERVDYFRKSWFLLDKVERESITFSMERKMKMTELRKYLD